MLKIMDHLKYFGLTLTILLLVASNGLGQPSDESVIEKYKEGVLKMAQSMGLSKQEIRPFGEIIQKYGLKSLEVLEKEGDDLATLRSTIQSIQKEQDQEVKALITPEQFTVYQELVKEERAKRRKAFIKARREG